MKPALIALLLLPMAAISKADTVQDFDVTGSMSATGYSGVTETLDFSFTIQYVPFLENEFTAEVLGPISVTSIGPMAGFTTSANRIIGENIYFPFLDPEGDEFDLGIANAVEQGPITAPIFSNNLTKMWSCQSQACIDAFQPNVTVATDLPDQGTEITNVIDPVIQTPEPSGIVMLICGLFIMLTASSRLRLL